MPLRKLEIFREVAREGPWRMLGRAATTLSELVERHPKEAFAGSRCARKLLRRGGLHIDPHGHLCFEARTLFWGRGLVRDEVGPGEIYTA